MKTKMLRTLAMLLAGVMLLSMMLSGCTPADQENPDDTPSDGDGTQPGGDQGNGDNGGEDDMNYVKLTAKGQQLFDATYQTMLDRLMESGYAQTSLTGAYQGMFVRDASIQVMAHIAAGDAEQAKKILQFMSAYHITGGADFAYHIMNEQVAKEVYDYVSGKMETAEVSSVGSVDREGYSTALYKINMPTNGCATQVTIPFASISEVAFYLEIGGTTGDIVVSIGTKAGDSSVAQERYAIKELKAGKGWYNFRFDEPVSVEAGEKYVLSVWAEDASANIISYGETRGGVDFNYDVPSWGGWAQNAQALACRVRPDTSIVGENKAMTQTFTAMGDHIDTIGITLNCSEKTKIHATLVDANGTALKALTAETEGGALTLDFGGVSITEGKEYGLSVWAESGIVTWNTGASSGVAYRTSDASKNDIGERYELKITPEYSGSLIAEKVTVGGSKTAEQVLGDELSGKLLTTVYLYLSGDAKAGDTYTVTLLKGDKVIDSLTRPLETLTAKATLQSFSFCLPLFETDDSDDYTLRVSASREGSVTWYGTKKDGETVMSYRVGCSEVAPLSQKIQVDGNYMWVNAFAMFALEYGEQYADFVDAIYDQMADYARYFIENDYIHENGLVYNPSYEHSRDGRYWESYDLITNCFASEAMHKMSEVATKLGKSDDATLFGDTADAIAEAVHNEMISEFDGKNIYTEMIALDEEGKVYKGFSFVNLAPIASDWYAVDEEILANTYNAYLAVGTEKYVGIDMLGVVIELDENDQVKKIGNHVIGKGLGWELYYLWKTGNTERLADVLEFVDKSSRDVYPEVWRNDGSVADSANQEQASWILYEVARITGLYKK